MGQSHFVLSFIIGLLLLAPIMGWAQSVAASDVVTVSVTVKGVQKDVACYRGDSGKVKSRRGNLVFRAFKVIIRSIKKKIKNANARNIPKLRKKLRSNKQLRKAGDASCPASSSGGGGNSGGGRSGGGNSGGGSNNGNNASSYFDIQGNVTAFGKATFGIPSHLPADVITGRTVFNTYCIGCHNERRRFTFAELRQAILQSPMDYDQTQLPDQDLAQIMAYVSRFRVPPN